jgi:AAA domain, putative AbiEii toxin, Type IV TA system
MTDSYPAKTNKPDLIRPRLTFESITFSDGQTLTLGDDDIVVLVGPNNAGKSAALRELEHFAGRTEQQKVITNVKLKQEGTAGTLRLWLEDNAMRVGASGSHSFSGMNFQIHQSHINFFEINHPNLHVVARFFASRVGTDSRLTGANPAGHRKLHFEPAEHPIHLLLTDELLAKRISAYFSRAFGKDLIVFHGGGSEFPLMVGSRPNLLPQENELSKRYIEALLANSEPLAEQGDGMRAFATILLHVLVADSYSMQFLDEPEAFLHPPQARLIGEFIAKERRARAQLFVATHSPEVLEGILAADSSKVRIVRIQRDGSINKIKELSREKTSTIANDPLTRYSRVLSGIFHQRVIVAESESDCLLYNALLNTTAVTGANSPDVLFIHAGGKDRMQQLASLLRALDVPVSVIADIDLLNDDVKFRMLFETLGGNWADLESDWKALNNTVLATRPPLTANHVRQRIEQELSEVEGNQAFPKGVERNIKSLFQGLSPWQQIKRLGRGGFDRGAPITMFDRIAAKCGESGLWIVPVGELEGFCRSIEARHGPDFAEKVLTQRDIETDAELTDAREFVRKIWHN